MKKNSIFILVLSILSLICGSFAIIFCMPTEIPLHISHQEIIDSLCSKWLIFINLFIIILLAALSLTLKKEYLKRFFSALFFAAIFVNTLIFAYYSIESGFEIGTTYKIPLSILIFFPLSFLIIVWAGLIKNLPFKSPFGIKNKFSCKTEFLWIQTQIAARDKFVAIGFILMIISIIFALFKLIFIELIIFILAITLAYILVLKDAYSAYKKYMDMKTRKENLQNKK